MTYQHAFLNGPSKRNTAGSGEAGRDRAFASHGAALVLKHHLERTCAGPGRLANSRFAFFHSHHAY